MSVDLKGVDMYDPEFNAGIAGPDWLDVSNFPQAVFESERIEMITPGQYLAIGTLTLKGNSETVTVPFHWIGGAQRVPVNRTRINFKPKLVLGSRHGQLGTVLGRQ